MPVEMSWALPGASLKVSDWFAQWNGKLQYLLVFFFNYLLCYTSGSLLRYERKQRNWNEFFWRFGGFVMGSINVNSYEEIVIDENLETSVNNLFLFFLFFPPQDTMYFCLLDTFVKLVVFCYQFLFFIFPLQERKLLFKWKVSLKTTGKKEAGGPLILDKKHYSWK